MSIGACASVHVHMFICRQQVASETLTTQQHVEWTARPCRELLTDPPAELITLLEQRMAASSKNAAEHQRRKGRSSTRGEPGTMECRGYGPCVVPGWNATQRVSDGQFSASACASTTPKEVLARMCARMAIDERTYLDARSRFDVMLGARGEEALAMQRQTLRAAGEDLEWRALEQARIPLHALEATAGVTLQRTYVSSSGAAVGGLWGPVDERVPLYRPHERARFSCANCSGDVVPAKDLIGCWPLWTQFAPDELRLRCSRTWTSDPGRSRPREYLEGGAQLPCWRTCWTSVLEPPRDEEPRGDAVRGDGAAGGRGGANRGEAARGGLPTRGGPLASGVEEDGHRLQPNGTRCTTTCPPAPLWPSALDWRREWEAALGTFNAEPGIGRDLTQAMAFVRAQRNTDFYWSIY